ncbi:MAG: hypothetical protein AAB796_00740, partial [Patescibacteria group bacterium]
MTEPQTKSFSLDTRSRLTAVFGRREQTDRHRYVNHIGMHASDIAGGWAIARHGEESAYRGIRHGLQIHLVKDRGLCLVEKRGSVNDRDFREKGMTVSGILGVECDEHGKKGPDGKRALDCEFTLIGKKLGLLREVPEASTSERGEYGFTIRDKTDQQRAKHFVVADHRLRDLFLFIANDDLNGSLPMNLAKIVKASYRLLPTQKPTIQWMFYFLDAVSATEPIPKEDRGNAYQSACSYLLTTLNALLKEKEFHSQAIAYIKSWIGKGEKNPRLSDEHIYDLADATALMLKAVSVGAITEEGAEKWAYWGLRIMLEAQHHFHAISPGEAGKAGVEKVSLRYRFGTSNYTELRSVVFIQSDDPFIFSYLRLEKLGYDPALIIKQGSSGDIQIHPGMFPALSSLPPGDEKKEYYRESLRDITRDIVVALRQEECRVRKIDMPSRDVLEQDEWDGDGSVWFRHGTAGWVMSKSLSG